MSDPTVPTDTIEVRSPADELKWKEQIRADIAFLERLAKDATAGAYTPMDCRHCSAPANCVDYAVVSAEAGMEVSHVWKEEDARFQAAASPQRILRLLKAYRELEAENQTLKAERRHQGESWVSTMLRETAQAIPSEEAWEKPIPTD
ncbi:hypothetical protein [Rhizobium sp. BK176]|uniref:hypothetical protein n=1 Tax=Rhizobium sp. BK176 TaxID=2587071 RepID=UPI0021691D7E|nr:hypothetical protein [Rhizobium sp. BK176]MCS4088497.1 hypothetical protein [Rhizobium sp. BK176]